tara:strand:- start:1438 stop:1614 length:177 start_codon:yes stop_codon:yes gene_type:complete
MVKGKREKRKEKEHVQIPSRQLENSLQTRHYYGNHIETGELRLIICQVDIFCTKILFF